jgi:hypothetical protein
MKTCLHFVPWPLLILIIDADCVLCEVRSEVEEIVVYETDYAVLAKVEETVDHRS